MQDLKHLTEKKRSRFFSGDQGNRRRSLPVTPFASVEIPTGRGRRRLGYTLLFLAIVLALTPVSMLIVKKVSPLVPRLAVWYRSASDRTPRPAEAARPPSSLFENACRLLENSTADGGRLMAQMPSGDRLEYCIIDGLQQRVRDYLAAHQVPYGVFVAVEPSSGRILAMTAHSSVDPRWARTAFFEPYPMASLFKIVTASAALEAGRITPDTVVEFRGKATSESPRYWEASPRGRNSRMDVTYAMGKSINPVYGRIACDIAGKDAVMENVRRFGFNQAILPGVPVKESRAGDPQTSHQLMLMGAGLDHDVKVTPLHAAMIMASIANGGRMMSPTLVDRVLDGAGGQKEAHVPRELRQLVSPATSASLTRMLSTTVTSGTSRRAFHDRRGRLILSGVDIAAKTGSINGDDPKGHYSWFAAYAPARAPRIALAALVINQDKWRIKASQVGEKALEEFFRD